MQKLIYITDTKDADINYIRDSNTITVFKGLNLIEVDHPADANQSATYLKLLKHYDIFMLSKSRRVLREAQNIYDYIRLVYEVKGAVKDVEKLAKRIFPSRIFTVCLEPINANQDLIRALHLRGIKVIIRAKTQLDVYKAALSGADGVIGRNLKKIKINSDIISLPFLVSHRGLSVNVPENSIQAAKEAYRTGANILEMDVHLTKDKKLVVNHDNSLGEAYTKDFVIKYNTLEELQEAKKVFNEKVLDETIETLAEFDKVLPNDFTFLIEAKVEGKDAIKELSKQVNKMKRNVMVMSFYPIALIHMDGLMKNNINGLLLSKNSEVMDLLPLIKVVNKYKLIVHPNCENTNPQWEDELKKRMIGYSPWGISKERLEDCLFKGYDMLNSDYIHELSHLPQQVITKRVITYHVGKDKELRLFNNKGEQIPFDVHIVDDNLKGLKIEKGIIKDAKEDGLAYLYLTHTAKIKTKSITYASDLVKVKIIKKKV